jgi:sulfite reductase (NADPH) flavoprotein alpha-component
VLRQALSTFHWLLGISAGLVLAVVGASGALLSLQNEMLDWLNPGVLSLEPQGRKPLAVPDLFAQAQSSQPAKRIVSFTVHADGRHAARAVFAPREARYVDPYTGQVSAPPRGAEFFRNVMELHRWLAAGDVGKQVVGASTVGLILLCLSGLYLRWPRRSRDWRAWLLLDPARKGRGFLRHLHETVGTWVLVPYLVMGLTGLYWSYDWYRDALFDATGTSRPAPPPRGAGTADVSVAWRVFEEKVGTRYTSATLRPTQPVQISFLDAQAPHDRAFSRMLVDSAHGTVLQFEPYGAKPAGAKLMAGIFPLHSGSFFGLPGVLAFMIASLAMPLFAVTGWMLYLRRRRPPTRAYSASAAGVTLAIHGAALAAIVSYQPARTATTPPAPLMVSLITPPKPEPKVEPKVDRPPQIVPPKPKPRPAVKAHARPPPPPPPAPAPAPLQAAPPPEPAPSPVAAVAPSPPEPRQPPTPPEDPAPVPVTPPVFNADYLVNPPPAYPALSRRKGEEGRVVLRVLVNAAGAAQAVEIRASSGHERLDVAALETVRRWKFVPARRGAEPVSAWVLVPISFKLEG